MKRLIATAICTGALMFLVGYWIGKGGLSFRDQEDWSRERMRAETSHALTMLDPAEINRRIVHLTDRANDENWRGMVDALELDIDRATEQEIRLITREWASREPREAYERISLWPEGKSELGLKQTFFVWATINPVAAKEAALLASDGEANSPFYGSVIFGWLSSGQSEAVDELEVNVPEGEFRDMLVSALAAQIRFREGSAGLAQFMEDIVSDEDRSLPFRTAVYNKTINLSGHYDPPHAVELIRIHEGADYAKDGRDELARRWIRTDPNATYAWVASLPESARPHEILGQPFHAWLKNNMEAANQWLSEQEADPLLDSPRLAQIDFLMKRKGQVLNAYEHSTLLSDPALVEEQQVKVLTRWLRANPRVAVAFYETQPIPESVKARDSSGV